MYPIQPYITPLWIFVSFALESAASPARSPEGSGAQGLGFRVRGSGFRGSEFRVRGLGFRL